MVRLLLSRRWLVRVVALAAVLVALGLLGWWQWERSREGGSLQNSVYAVEWWAFGGCAVYLWWRTLRDESRLGPGVSAGPGSPPAVPAPRVLATRPAEPAVPDPEVDAYNDYLAWLNAHPRR